jgi:hypothetical protein
MWPIRMVALTRFSRCPCQSGRPFCECRDHPPSARIRYAVGYYVTAHEISHILGCGHDAANGYGAYPFSHGWVFSVASVPSYQFDTVMAYPGDETGKAHLTGFAGVADREIACAVFQTLHGVVVRHAQNQQTHCHATRIPENRNA